MRVSVAAIGLEITGQLDHSPVFVVVQIEEVESRELSRRRVNGWGVIVPYADAALNPQRVPGAREHPRYDRDVSANWIRERRAVGAGCVPTHCDHPSGADEGFSK